MSTAQRILSDAQTDIAMLGGEWFDSLLAPYLLVAPTAHGFSVSFWGDYWSAAFERCLAALAHPAVAPQLHVLAFGGPDTGANGTRAWDFSPLLRTDATFPQLQRMTVDGTRSEDHNRTIIGADYEENGQIAGLLDRCPRLRQLNVPSAPDRRFFQRPAHPLELLTVQAGYDRQDFIEHLSQTVCFPQLRILDYTDYSETYMPDWQESCTPFSAFQALFATPAFRSVRGVRLRNTLLTAEHAQQLKASDPTRQLILIEQHRRTGGPYGS